MAAELEDTLARVGGLEPVAPSSRKPSSVIREAARQRRGRIALALLAFVVLCAGLGPLLTPDSPEAFVVAPFAGPSSGHLLGGDALGRDVLSRFLDGGWELLTIALVATFLGVLSGAVIGIVAAVEGHRTESILMRSVDVFLAFPQLVFALLLVSVVGPKVWLLVVAAALAHMPAVARVIRAAAQDVAERDFVRYSQMLGLSRRTVIFSEILPNLTSPLMVEAGLRLTYSVIILTGLSFLGFGLQPPGANWGSMINENRIGLVSNPWGVIAPSVILILLTIGTNLFTDVVAQVSLRGAGPGRRRDRKRGRGKSKDASAGTAVA